MPTVPQILCRFHIQENVNHRFRKAFRVGSFVKGSQGEINAIATFNEVKVKWLDVIDTHIINTHNVIWTVFINAYETDYSTLITYLRDT